MIEIENIKKQLNNNPDISVRELNVSNKNISLVFLKSTIDKMLFVQSVLSPILSHKGEISFDILQKQILSVIDVEKTNKNYAV